MLESRNGPCYDGSAIKCWKLEAQEIKLVLLKYNKSQWQRNNLSAEESCENCLVFTKFGPLGPISQISQKQSESWAEQIVDVLDEAPILKPPAIDPENWKEIRDRK